MYCIHIRAATDIYQSITCKGKITGTFNKDFQNAGIHKE